jgi:hypothetical protein
MELIALVSLWMIFLGLLFYARTDTLRQLFLYAFGALLFFPLALASWFVWAFRDGIALDSVSGEGWDAWVLFFRDIWPFLIFVTVFIVAGYFANRSARKRIEAHTEPQSSMLER